MKANDGSLSEVGALYGEVMDEFAPTQVQIAEYAEVHDLSIAEARKELYGKRKKGIKIEFTDRLKGLRHRTYQRC
ncbi:MAG TPA: hypothetical protein VN643_17860 [Pyrinomonadaceae bacterium]|nr:hypothetical protein [Pyrinomonadaceae bacterium]